MRELNTLFEQNAKWSENVRASDASFFERLSQQQAPEYLCLMTRRMMQDIGMVDLLYKITIVHLGVIVSANKLATA